MEKSVLTATVIEARYIKLTDYNSQADIYVVVECGNHSAQTKHIEGVQNPIWDETFHFDISNGKEEIRVSIMDRNMMKQDTVVGVLYIPIQTLSDQQKVEDWFNLEDPHGGYGESNGRIRLQLWWIHSKTKLIEDRIMQTEEDIDKIHGDKQYYIDKVSQLREPFPWLENVPAITKSSSSFNATPNGFDNYRIGTFQSEDESEDEEMRTNPLVKAVNTVWQPEKALAKSVESTFDNFSQEILGLRTTPWFRLMQWSAIIYCILTLCSCFLRTDFINLTVCVLICYCISKINTLKRWQFRMIVYGLITSWFSDLLWIIMHTSSWWKRANYDGDVELTLRRVVVIISFLSFLFRIFIILIFWKLSLYHKRRMRSSI